MNEIDRKYLLDVADALDRAPRQGASADNPEGTRYISISSILADIVAGTLRAIAERN